MIKKIKKSFIIFVCLISFVGQSVFAINNVKIEDSIERIHEQENNLKKEIQECEESIDVQSLGSNKGRDFDVVHEKTIELVTNYGFKINDLKKLYQKYNCNSDSIDDISDESFNNKNSALFKSSSDEEIIKLKNNLNECLSRKHLNDVDGCSKISEFNDKFDKIDDFEEFLKSNGSVNSQVLDSIDNKTQISSGAFNKISVVLSVAQLLLDAYKAYEEMKKKEAEERQRQQQQQAAGGKVKVPEPKASNPNQANPDQSSIDPDQNIKKWIKIKDDLRKEKEKCEILKLRKMFGYDYKGPEVGVHQGTDFDLVEFGVCDLRMLKIELATISTKIKSCDPIKSNCDEYNHYEVKTIDFGKYIDDCISNGGPKTSEEKQRCEKRSQSIEKQTGIVFDQVQKIRNQYEPKKTLGTPLDAANLYVPNAK